MNNTARADGLAVAPKRASWLGGPELRLILLASLLLICGMVAIGFWAGRRVEDGAPQRAASGTVLNTASDDLSDEENGFERSFGLPLLEVYAPMRERGTNRIIAVAEFYEMHENIRSELASIRQQSWAIVVSLTVALVAAMSAIVFRLKRHALKQRVHGLAALLAANRELRQQHASCRNGLLQVVVADDGLPAGCVTPGPDADCLGLKGLRGRIEAIGGLLEFQAQPGQGKRLTAQSNLFRRPDHG